MKKILKIIIIGILTVSIATGCVRFSKEDKETNAPKESSNKVFSEWIGKKVIDSIKINALKNNVKIYYHNNETILIKDIDKLLAALVSSAKPKETSETNNENSTTLNAEKEVSNSENNTTLNDNKDNTNEETTTSKSENTTEKTAEEK